MEINDENLKQLAEVLKQTLNPSAVERKTAEVSFVFVFCLWKANNLETFGQLSGIGWVYFNTFDMYREARYGHYW